MRWMAFFLFLVLRVPSRAAEHTHYIRGIKDAVHVLVAKMNQGINVILLNSQYCDRASDGKFSLYIVIDDFSAWQLSRLCRHQSLQLIHIYH